MSNKFLPNIPYIVYKTTNLVNSKIYIGVHATKVPNEFDGYFGSGKLLRCAIKKYGRKNFVREVLYTFSNYTDAYKKEREIVTPEFVKRDDTYNITSGGFGVGANEMHPLYGTHFTEERLKQHTENFSGKNHPNYGKKFSKETRKRISDARQGRFYGVDNPHYGKHHSDATKALLSNLAKQRYQTSRHPWKGRHHTEAAKEKMRQSALGTKVTVASRIKISQTNLGVAVFYQRVQDIEASDRGYGWRVRLAAKWGLSGSGVDSFIKFYDSIKEELDNFEPVV